jgi:antirestriction protein ArdC
MLIARPTTLAIKTLRTAYRPSKFRANQTIKRLDRDLKGRFGQAAYAAEELVAELGAAFLAAEFSFDGDVRHAGYIAN